MRVLNPTLILICTMAVLITSIQSVSGQVTTDKEQARRHFAAATAKLKEAGKQILNVDRWKQLKASAVLDLTRAIELDPDNREYLLERAAATDDAELALRDVNKVLAVNPNDAEVYIRRAEAYHNGGESELALADFNRAIALDPKNPTFYCDRAFFYMIEGDREKELDDYNKAIEIDPYHKDALLSRSSIYQQKGDYSNALKDLNLIIEKYPEKATSYHLFRAEIYEATKQFAKALADVDLAVRSMPDKPGPLERRAELHRKMGRPTLAVKDELAAKKLRKR